MVWSPHWNNNIYNSIQLYYLSKVCLFKNQDGNFFEVKQTKYFQCNYSGHTVQRRLNMLVKKRYTEEAEAGAWARGEWKHRLWARVAHTQTPAQAVWLAICLSDWLVEWVFGTHTKTNLSISLSLLLTLSFPFLLLLFAPSRSLCLCTQTNQSSFDLLEMSLASERHFECDEWDEGGEGLPEDASKEQDGRYSGANSAEEVLLNSLAHY